jgi:hypothetical protein
MSIHIDSNSLQWIAAELLIASYVENITSITSDFLHAPTE